MGNYKALHWLNNKSFGDCYYLDQGSCCVYRYRQGKGKVLLAKRQMRHQSKGKGKGAYKKGDTIEVVLDCNRWTLKILRNGENIAADGEPQELQVAKNRYFPAVAFYYPM